MASGLVVRSFTDAFDVAQDFPDESFPLLDRCRGHR